MAASNEIMKNRRKLATDLRRLSGIIYEFFPTAEISSFESAISALRNKEIIPQIPEKGSNNNLWEYNLGRLIFNFDSIPRHTKPENCKDLKLILDIKTIGNCNDLKSMKDPFEWLEFNIVIEGTKFSEEGNKQLITSYHLDRHIMNEDDGDGEYPHPIYHFQFGGRKLAELGQMIDTGNLLVFDSPRIAHYPMEAVLGIDFTLSNFFPNIWKKIKAESNEYINLIEEYQDLFLKPYIHTHASQWNYSSDQILTSPIWSPNMICPQLFNS
ncbi:hypothetical protein SAMN04488009_2262 [Maribacter sedimenticola]|uniref:Uncharacterized protein n=1 Tax=Maribacter sedimenticola TaxID=228956 RepID=A0ABY1SHJ9_9FLAO|nr:hypothetical protein [Maribacter sedimenticola]SNR54174.1 hypothetical protein SAMN04488009_2262 [Maribacter sedimenticola]